MAAEGSILNEVERQYPTEGAYETVDMPGHAAVDQWL